MNKRNLMSFLALPLLLAFALVVYYLPPVHSRLAWRVDELKVVINSILSPPERVDFIPQQQGLPTIVPTVFSNPSETPTSQPSPTSIVPESTPIPPSTATPTPTPLPEKMNLSGVRYEHQHGLWNYCAPANLSMALSFWGWDGDRLVAGKALKPYGKDKNVMPYEMEEYVNTQTDLAALTRVGGNLELLKRLIAAGYPVLVEKGAWIRDFTKVVSWMGHYQVVTGYDEERQVMIGQDSFYTPDYEVAYEDFIKGWRSFNYTYLIIFPPDRENQVMELLGEDADVTANYQRTAKLASDEIYALSGVDQFFAWFNRGTNLKELQDFGGAAAAYDQAFAVYNTLPVDRSIRPYRILWYQTGPYFAYFYIGRYYDVLSLATTAIEAALDEPAIEESFYWRGMAKNALGDTSGAIQDFREALKYHPDFGPAVYQLTQLGATP